MTPYIELTAQAGQTEFDINFPYISRTHVEVRVNGVIAPIIEWISPSRPKIGFSITGGEFIAIERITPLDGPLVVFQDGAVLTKEDLNLAVQQLLYRQQEVTALYERTLSRAKVRLAEHLGIVTDPEAVIDELINLVLEDQLLEEFRQRFADIDANAEAIVDEAFARVGAIDTVTDQLLSEAERLDQRVDDVLESLTEDLGDKYAEIRSRVSKSLTDTEALAQSVAALVVRMSESQSAIVRESEARSTETSAMARDLTAVTARVSTAEAGIISEQTARVDADEALATDITALEARMGTAEADIVSEQTVRSDADGALASDISGLIVRMDNAEADIVSEQTARATADSALTTSVNGLLTRMGDAEAAIISEETARVDGDEALATDIDQLTTRMGDAEAAIVSEQSARSTADSALTTSVQTLQADVGNVRSSVYSENGARVTADEAFANSIMGLVTKLSEVQAGVVSEATVRTTETEAQARTLSGLDVRMGAAEASVLNEQTARVSGDDALASQITSVITTVNGNTASISTLSSSVNGLQTKYGVSLDVNGYVTGFVQHNNGTTGDFTIVANKFAIVEPGVTPFVPFEVSGGVVRMKSAVIGDLTIGTTKLALNVVNEVSKATLSPVTKSGSQGSSILDYTVSKPANTTYIRVTMTGNIRYQAGTGGDWHNRVALYLRGDGISFRRADKELDLLQYTQRYTDFNMTYMFDASDLDNGDVLSLYLETSVPGGVVQDLYFTFTQTIVEYIKR